jgi:hypothetical protein
MARRSADPAQPRLAHDGIAALCTKSHHRRQQSAPAILALTAAAARNTHYLMTQLEPLPIKPARRRRALRRAITSRFERPPILEATKACLLLDQDLAFLLGITPMVVNGWVKGRRPIPPFRHAAMIIFMMTLAGVIDEAPGDTPQARRARLISDAVMRWIDLALDELLVPPQTVLPDHVLEPAEALANAMLSKFGDAAMVAK